APAPIAPVAPAIPVAPVAPAIPVAAVATADLDAASNLNLREAIDRVERELIEAALKRSNGNRTEAAALLGLNRTTLVEKLRKTANG
ncbi:AAA family ATPase, partial [Myxococcota bacterium]|nr:AAA family ATPase [Myxococcota bacterium]